MIRTAASLILVAGLSMGLAQAPKPAAKAAPPVRPAASAGPFDAQDPMSLIALLASLDAQATISGKAEDAVNLKVTTPAYAFGAQYAGCDAQGRKCKAVAFSTLSTSRTATLAQLNGFNQSSITCRVWQDRQGKPHVMYSALVQPQDSREAMRGHLGAWQGCLATFGDFLADPNAYLASAP
ncbi:hypothetical protein [Phenylobacterium sp.]|uniref:hypothetical protein n=1 Tax=Phenylobacterium sp. TaxID=1871053 RepID=UPI003983AA0D